MKKGQKVYIINRKLSGKFFVEGIATIVTPGKTPDDPCTVRFFDWAALSTKRTWGAERFQRFVDPAAQEDPHGYVKRLNEEAA